MQDYIDYVSHIAEMCDRVSRQKSVITDRTIHILEYLECCKENAILVDVPTIYGLFIIFPEGVVSDKLYIKLLRNGFIDPKSERMTPVKIVMFPPHKKYVDVFASIVFSI